MAAPRARYQPDRRGMRKLMKSPDIAKITEAAAENAANYAASIAPRDTGEYADSFEVESRIVGDRQTSVVFNSVKYANTLEQRYRVLARSVDHAKP